MFLLPLSSPSPLPFHSLLLPLSSPSSPLSILSPPFPLLPLLQFASPFPSLNLLLNSHFIPSSFFPSSSNVLPSLPSFPSPHLSYLFPIISSTSYFPLLHSHLLLILPLNPSFPKFLPLPAHIFSTHSSYPLILFLPPPLTHPSPPLIYFLLSSILLPPHLQLLNN